MVWEAGSLAGLIPSRVLPVPTDVVAAGWKLLLSGELLRNIWVSFWRAIVGFAIGGSIGFVLGLANGLSRRSERILDSTLQMVRNIPHLALIPLVILWFGIGETAKLEVRPETGRGNGGAFRTRTHALAECFSLHWPSNSAGVKYPSEE